MYNLNGKPTPYSQLPPSVRAALGKRAIRQATQAAKKKKPAPKQNVSYAKSKAPKDSAITRASGVTSYKGMSAREIMRERENLYKKGYHNLAPVGFKMTNDSRNAPPKNYAEALKRDQAAGYYQNVDKKDLGLKGATWDQRMTSQFDYTVRDPSTGQEKTFDSQQQAQAFINQNPLKQVETTTTEKYEVVGNNGKTRTFKSKASAEKYAATQTTTQSSFIGFSPDGKSIQGAPAPEYVEVKYPKPGDKVIIPQMGKKSIVHTITEKPLSSSGQRLELIAGWLDEQQIKAKKADKVSYYKDPYGIPQQQGGVNLLPMAIEGAKDIVAGAAYLENLFWMGEAAARGSSETKTREIKIPETAMGVLTTGAIEGKSPAEIWKAGAAYEKTYGKGTILAGGATALIPVPGLKGLNVIKSIKASPLGIKIIQPLSSKLAPIATKIKVPKIKNVAAKVQESFVDIGQKRIVKKYAVSRSSEGVFGVTKISKNIWKIERGVEEVTKPVSQATKIIQTGWTKTKGIIYPSFAKTPKKIIIPKPGKIADVPLTIVEFGKQYTKKGSKLLEVSTPFKKPAAMKLPLLAKAPKKAVTKRPKKMSKIIKKSLGINLGLKVPKGIFGKIITKKKSKGITMFHATSPESAKSILGSQKFNMKSVGNFGAVKVDGVYLASTKTFAGQFGEKILKVGIKKDTKIITTKALNIKAGKTLSLNEAIKTAQKRGYDALEGLEGKPWEIPNKVTILFNPKKIQSITKLGAKDPSVKIKIPKSSMIKSVTKSLGIGIKKKRVKVKKLTLTEVTDFMAVQRGEYQTVGTKKVLLTAADPDFAKQAKGLKLEKISKTGFAGKMSKNLLEAEQLGLVKLSAVGKSIPMKLAKEGDFAGFIGKQSRITKVFELGKGGLGKADFTKDITKKGDIISIGSKDFTRKLEGVGLGTKRIMKKGSYADSSTIPTGLGRAGGGAAARLEETTKKSIIGSFAKTESKELTKPLNVSLEKLTGSVKTKPAGAGLMGGAIVETQSMSYFKSENIYKRNKRKDVAVFTDSELAEELMPYELSSKSKAIGNTITIPRLTSRGATRQLTRTETKLLGKTKSKLSIDVAPKIKTGILTKQVERLVEKNDQFRIQLPKLGKVQKTRTVTKLIETPVLKFDTPTRFRIVTRTDTPTIKITKLVPGYIPLNIKAKRKKKHDKDKTYQADFLGASSESSILGLTGRADITYGRLKTARLTALDLRKRKSVSSSINPENVKFKKRRKKVDPDIYKQTKRTGRQISANTSRALFGSNKKVKF